MKRFFSLVFALMLVVMLTVSDSAAQQPRLLDGANLLTDAEEAELLARLDQVSRELQCDVVIITVRSCEGYSADYVIEQFYDQYGYGYGSNRDGVMLLLSMAERDWRILSNGFAANAITPSDIDKIGDQIVPELSAGDYEDAFLEFAELCKYEIEGERYGFPFPWAQSLLISLAVGFVAAFIATAVMRGKLKSVRKQTGARQYTRQGSMHLTHSTDLFLYSTVNRRPRPKETSHSSSGSRGGGGGGRHVGGGKF